MLNIKDEILDTTGQTNSNPRYTIRDNNGNVLFDNVIIELKTPLIQEGTPLNKVVFDEIQETTSKEVVFNPDGSITETTPNVTTTTTFNSDGSITETSVQGQGQDTITRTTVFNNDGSIDITVEEE